MTSHHQPLLFALMLGILGLMPALGEEAAAAPSPTTILPLWPSGSMPGNGCEEAEKDLPPRGDHVRRITNVSEPTISLFQAMNQTTPTPAIIICPGGAYGLLAYNSEGTEIAAWLNSIGITGVVLKYRVPNNMAGAFHDIQRAIRLVRTNAKAWNIATDRVGVMGFSAGGHLCARLSTNHAQATYARIDAVDDVVIRPDFAILVYPAYLSQVPGTLAGNLPVTAQTPSTFLVHTADDPFVRGTKLYDEALTAAQVPHAFFFCAEGGHGYGLRSQKEVRVWPQKLQEWLAKSLFR